jgi:hypothetical protein
MVLRYLQSGGTDTDAKQNVGAEPRPSGGDAGEQQVTRDWWARRTEFELRIPAVQLRLGRLQCPDLAAEKSYGSRWA